MNFITLSIFPEFFESATNFSLLKKAQEKGLIRVENLNLRNWAEPRSIHKMVDDRPFGGGAGMVLMVEPVYQALRELRVNSRKLKVENKSKIVIFSPKGRKYDQTIVEEFTKFDEIILICPHYEGFDERILEFVDEEISIGDYILTGGEIPALIIIDSVARFIPGVLGNEISAKTESFSELKIGRRNLEYPQYTRPAVFSDEAGMEYKVPDVLLSGNHKEIEKWRTTNSQLH